LAVASHAEPVTLCNLHHHAPEPEAAAVIKVHVAQAESSKTFGGRSFSSDIRLLAVMRFSA
jgi:hypothetical protein